MCNSIMVHQRMILSSLQFEIQWGYFVTTEFLHGLVLHITFKAK